MAGDPFALSTTAASNTTIDSVPSGTGMDADKVDDAIRQLAANYACFVSDTSGGLLAGGTANARTVTANSTYSTYANGRIITARIPAVNTGSATLNVNGIGAKQVRLQTPTGDVALSGGEMNGTHTFLYLEAANSAAGGWILLNPIQTAVDYTSSLTLTAAQQATARGNISSPLKGHIFGLTLSNNTSDATNDIDIAAGEAASTESNPVLMVLASGITKRLDASWSVGTGNGGLDTGSIANTTYHVWLIQRSDTGVVDVLFSTSATSPTMPANYDRKRRIGSIIRESGAIVAFYQNGDTFQRPKAQDRNSTTAGSGVIDLSVPQGIVVAPLVEVLLAGGASTSSSFSLGSISNGSANVVVATLLNGTGEQSRAVGTPPPNFYTNTLGRLYYALSNTSGAPTTCTLNTYGWVDRRGRDD